MRSNLVALSMRTTGACGLCGTVGLHAHFDRDLRDLVGDCCFWEVTWAEVFIRDTHAWNAPVYPEENLARRIRKFEESGLRRMRG